MPSIQNITNIPAPRVNFIDERTGLMSREWYRFFLNLFTLTGGGTNPTSLEDLQLGPAFELTPDMFVVDSLSPDANSSITTLSKSVDDLGQSLQTLPVDFGGTVSSVNVTLATTGTDVSFSATNSTTAPVIALSIPTASATNRGALSAADWTAFNAKGSGSVTSVGQTFTGGIISVGGSPITTSGTLALTVAGTSGGVVYFTSASTWATSAVLAANALVVGGGAGLAPATVTTGTNVLTALGVAVGTAGSFVVNGGVLGTPSSGTVTNLTGTASININGTVGATTANTGAFTSLSYTTTLTGGTGIVNLGSGQFYKDASGNVGIGTSSPGYKLEVSGITRAFADTATGTSNFIAANTSILNNTTKYAAHLFQGTDTVGTLKSSGFLLVGPSDANYVASYMAFQTRSADVLSERMRIDNVGNVGIGTSSPASKLDVGAGDLRFSSTGQRVLGDMSNATIANRLAFQSSTVNGNTNVHIIPNGTSVIAGFKVESDSAITTGQVIDRKSVV
jgi:hypothetical protein